MKANWHKALTDYISDESLSYDDISKKYNVSIDAVKRIAVKEEWVKLRSETKQKIIQKLPEKTGDKIAEVNARHANFAKILQGISIRAITSKEKGKEPEFKPSSFEDARLGLLTGVNIERNAMQIKDETAVTNIQINFGKEINDFAT